VSPRLIAITDRSLASFAETCARFERVARAAQPGSVLFQLRDRELPARERLELGRELGALAKAEGQGFQVNDRLDLALLLEADAVHLGEGSVPAVDARRVIGRACFLTRACHDPARAVEAGVDAWLVSPIAAARKGRAPLGLGVFGGGRKLYALGGITAENARECRAAGAVGVAVVGAVLAEPDPLPLLRALDIAR
jgi:thiamine-phosphate pyrophosphorylase